MKVFGIVLIVTGLVAFAMPVVGFLIKGKPQEEVVEKKMDPLSFGPMLGVMLLSVGAGILVAGAITGKK